MAAMCQLCQMHPVYEPLNPEAIRALKQALLVDSPDYDPIVCDGCFARVMKNAPKMEVSNILLRAG